MDYYAVIGNPISHSLSPVIHHFFAEQTNQRLFYRSILTDHDRLPDVIANFQSEGGKGLNITAPFKQAVFTLVDQYSERAKMAGTVNTIVFQSDGTRYGDNTDGVGLLRDLENKGFSLLGKTILLLGAGGAACGIIPALLSAKPAQLIIVNRTKEKALFLADQYQATHDRICSLAVDELMGHHFDLILNTVPNDIDLKLPPGILNQGGLCYDLGYSRQNTVFYKWATAQNAHFSNGLGMLVEQAAESFYCWYGIQPYTLPVHAACAAINHYSALSFHV